jgi:hypothetical protein
MIRLLAVLALAPLLSGCVVATVAGVAVGAVKTTARAAGTVVETAVDATTTTQQEADEDRGRAIRLEEERQAKEAERQRKEAERQRREAERLGQQPAPQPATPDTAPPDSAGPTR